jgi:hypothetical protein
MGRRPAVIRQWGIMTRIYIIIFSALFLTNGYSQTFNWDTSFVAAGHSYSFKTFDLHSDQLTLTIWTDNKITSLDTVITLGLFDMRFTDINKDKIPELLVVHGGNNFVYDLYMIDAKTQTYKLVDQYNLYPEAKQLDVDKSCYYSYHRAGCADMVWVSDLFKIVNNKTVLLGTIKGECCGSESGQEDRIVALKKYPDKFIETDFFKCTEIEKYDDTKWGFIKDYWNKNIKKYHGAD